MIEIVPWRPVARPEFRLDPNSTMDVNIRKSVGREDVAIAEFISTTRHSKTRVSPIVAIQSRRLERATADLLTQHYLYANQGMENVAYVNTGDEPQITIFRTKNSEDRPTPDDIAAALYGIREEVFKAGLGYRVDSLMNFVHLKKLKKEGFQKLNM